MFNTFVTVASPNRAVPSVSSQDSKSKAKRKQVSRACTLCRINRTKCDDYVPYSSCKIKGSTCSKSGSINARTLSSANREIDELRARVKALENDPSTAPRRIDKSPPLSPPSSATPQSLCFPKAITQDSKQKSWPGVKSHDPLTGNVQYYGPLSSIAFLDRTASFLSSVFQQPLSASDLLPGSVGIGCLREGEVEAHLEMPHRQQECLLNLFWQTYHCLMPVVCEQEFRRLFESVWTKSLDRHIRKPSPLVDIILALCIQYGHTFMKDPESSDILDSKSVFFFNQSRLELAKEWEIPSISTVQSYIFVAIYLQNIANFNAAHNALALAVRIAYTIGLHLEPPEDIPRPHQEIRRRIWWGLYVLDVKLSVELGRPWAIDTSQVACTLPADDSDLAQLSGPNFSFPLIYTNWLSFHLQNIKLAIAARAVHEKFTSDSSRILRSRQADEVYRDLESLEGCALLLGHCMESLETWAVELPEGLKTKRKGSGPPLSTDWTSLDIETGAPLWVQLQRVAPLADGLAIMSLNHSLTITNISHQFLTKHDTLAGWYDAYHVLWNAALTIQGYAIAYPVCPPTPSARKYVNIAIEALEILGKDIPTAVGAVRIMRDLNSKARSLMDQFRKAVDAPVALSRSARAVDISSNESPAAWTSSPNPWLVDILNVPAANDSLNSLDDDLQWPDVEQCNVEMWASFLNILEGSLMETDPFDSVDMRVGV